MYKMMLQNVKLWLYNIVSTQSYANCMMQQDQNRTQLTAEKRQRLRSLGKCLSKHSGPSTTPKTFGQIMGSC